MTHRPVDSVLPSVALVLPAGTPAQMADAMQRTVYAMRDRLMRHFAYDERLATELATLAVDTLQSLSYAELVATRAAVERAKRKRRDDEIRRDIRTGNAAELARRHGLTERQVYNIARAR